ncbi:MAG: universal stress protein [Nitrospiraceae bacterium]
MYTKVMVAIDGSEISQNAQEEGVHIANSYGAKLCIVHVIGDSEDAARQAGNDLLNQAKSTVRSAQPVETRLEQADALYGLNGVSEAIAGAVKDWNADLLVVGTANRRGLERMVIGSVAEQVIAKVESSILLVRPR